MARDGRAQAAAAADRPATWARGFPHSRARRKRCAKVWCRLPSFVKITAMMRKASWLSYLVLAMVLTASVSCGYALEGRGSFLPDHILHIGIPTFRNLTTQPGLAEVITSEIYSQFVTRGDFNLSGATSGVDAVLEGEITAYNYIPRAIDEEGMATSYMIQITANISFRDLVENTVLWEQRGYVFQSEYQLSRDESDFVTQESYAVRLAAEDFASSVVGTILTGF